MKPMLPLPALCVATAARVQTVRSISNPMQHSPRFLALVNAVRSRVREISVDEVRRRLEAGEQFVLVDTREESEWGAGHIPGAIHLGKGVIERDVEKAIPDPDTSIVLYCGGGFRSVLAADALEQMGYTNVESMTGGWRAWQEKT